MTEDERNQYESTLWELEHDGYIDAPNLIRQQQAEIEALTKFLDETCQIGKFIVWNSTDKAQEK